MKLEARVIDAVAAVSPWLAPAIPAYLTAHHAWRYLAQGTEWIDVAFVGVCALAVETVGLSAVHTAVEFWTYNDERRQSDDPAPFRLAIGAGAFYVALVLVVNAVLDATQAAWALILAKALLSLLSVDAALVIAMRAQHARRLAETERLKAEKKAEKAVRRAEKVVSPAEKPEKTAWVKSHMGEMNVSRATAYREYARLFETPGNGHETE